MKNTFKIISRLALAVTGIVFIIISMVTDKITPYLALGLAFTALANLSNCMVLSKGYNPKIKDSSLEE